MPHCFTCAELENPDWQTNPQNRNEQGFQHLSAKWLSWREYLQHKFLKKYKGHESYLHL